MKVYQNMYIAYRRRGMCMKADRNHYDVRECPDYYDTRESVNTMVKALAARCLPCKHVVAHHDETLRYEE
jgi:hypothetical protein